MEVWSTPDIKTSTPTSHQMAAQLSASLFTVPQLFFCDFCCQWFQEHFLELSAL